MFITFYDRNFNTISDNSSLVVQGFKLLRRAYDLNEFTCVCEPIDLTVQPFFAVMRENVGTHYYTMLTPLVTRNEENKSDIVARDLFAVFNTKCVIDFTVLQPTVPALFQFIFNAWKNWDISGFENVSLDVSQITSVSETVYQPTEKAVYNVKDLFSRLLANYRLFIDSKIDIKTKTLNFIIRKSYENTTKIKLEDFGITDFNKFIPEINTATAMNTGFTVRHNWYLLLDGAITTQSALRNIFPTSGNIFTNNDINAADFEAVTALAENRYQETIPIKIVSSSDLQVEIFRFERLKNIDFNTNFEVYYKGAYYKTLPVGEIEDSETRERTIKLGFLPTDFIQVI